MQEHGKWGLCAWYFHLMYPLRGVYSKYQWFSMGIWSLQLTEQIFQLFLAYLLKFHLKRKDKILLTMDLLVLFLALLQMLVGLFQLLLRSKFFYENIKFTYFSFIKDVSLSLSVLRQEAFNCFCRSHIDSIWFLKSLKFVNNCTFFFNKVILIISFL